MPTAIRHPFSTMTYRLVAENRVRVEDGNRWGLFDRNGFWLEGGVRSADPSFCRFMASEWTIIERRRKLGKAYQ